MEMTKVQKYTYYFIRYTLLIAYPVFITTAIANLVLGPSIPEYFLDYVLVIIGIPFLIVNMILPGIIYEGNYKAAWHGFTIDQFKYNLFFGLTLGLGPTYLFFFKHDRVLKKLLKDQKNKDITNKCR